MALEINATVEVPDGYTISIVPDYEYDPRTAVDWPTDETEAYVAKFASGELHAYGVLLVNDESEEIVNSVWGCDVETGNADNNYSKIANIPDEYLRSVARDLIEAL